MQNDGLSRLTQRTQSGWLSAGWPAQGSRDRSWAKLCAVVKRYRQTEWNPKKEFSSAFKRTHATTTQCDRPQVQRTQILLIAKRRRIHLATKWTEQLNCGETTTVENGVERIFGILPAGENVSTEETLHPGHDTLLAAQAGQREPPVRDQSEGGGQASGRREHERLASGACGGLFQPNQPHLRHHLGVLPAPDCSRRPATRPSATLAQ